MYQFTALRFARAAVLAALFSCAHAAELGEAVVRSHIGQNLIANIELTGLRDPAVPVVVRQAHADIYRGANIAMAPVLSHVQLSVMRRDGRQFLHIVSTRPVNAEHLNLFLDLADGGRRHVRAVTLWLTPDPHPAPPPAPAPLPATVPAPVLAAPAAPAKPAPLPKPVPTSKPAPEPLVQKARASAPAACAPVNPEQLRTCAALDYKNGMLQARIVELEEKVKALQLAIDGRSDIAPLPVAKTATQLVMPKPKQKPDQPFPWLLAGAGVAGIGMLAGLALFLRRKKAMLKGEPLGPGLLTRLKSRLRRTAKAAPEPVAN